MKVKKNQFDESLRPYVYKGIFISKLISRKWMINPINALTNLGKGKNIKDLDCKEAYIPSNNEGKDIRVRIYRPKKNSGTTLPVMLYNHGGGYMLGSPEGSSILFKYFIEKRKCVIVAPDYRKSIKHPYPAGFNDCYDTLLWIRDNANSLNINPSKLIVAGHSAGGGLTAAVTLKARDTGDVNIAFQMPIYPMIDYRQKTNSAQKFNSVPVWNSVTNALGWNLYLKDTKGVVPLYASPSLNNDYTNFPPTITFVGDLEPFLDETINYVEALKNANVPVKFELFKGVFHAAESIAPKSAMARKENGFLLNAYAEYYDKFL